MRRGRQAKVNFYPLGLPSEAPETGRTPRAAGGSCGTFWMSEHTETRRGSGMPEATPQFPGRAGAGFLPSDSWATLQGLQADDGLNIVRARVGSGWAGCPHVGSGHREWRLRRGRQRAREPGPGALELLLAPRCGPAPEAGPALPAALMEGIRSHTCRQVLVCPPPTLAQVAGPQVGTAAGTLFPSQARFQRPRGTCRGKP